MSETRYIISDAAKMIDVEPHVLRYWEEELCIDIPRNEMGHRYYTDKEVKIFSAVRDLKAKGFQLKAIKMVLSAISEQLPADNIIPLAAVRKGGAAEIHKGTSAEKRTGKHEKAGRSAEDCVEAESVCDDDACGQAGGAVESGADTVHTKTDDINAEHTKADREKTSDKKTALQAVKTADMAESAAMFTAEEKMKHFKYMMDSIMQQALQKNNENFAEMLADRLSDRVIGEMDDLFRIQEEREEARFRDLDEMMRSRQRGRKEAAASGTGRRDGRRGLFKKGKM